MTNWPLNTASRYEIIGATGSPINEGTAITTGGANTKGSYASLGTTTFEADEFVFTCLITGTSDRYRIDIAFNTGGSDVVVVEDWWLDNINSICATLTQRFPIQVPSGATIKVRAQALGASRTLVAAVTTFATGFPKVFGGSKIRSCTDWTNTLPTGSVAQTGNTVTAWTQICATTPARISRLYLVPSYANDTSRTQSDMIIDIGMGASSSEQTIGQFLAWQSASRVAMGVYEMPCDIASGKRLAFRAATQSSSAVDSLSVAAMGLVA